MQTNSLIELASIA